MKVKSEREVAQLCTTLSDLVNCSLPGSSVHGIFQARVLEWVAIAFSVISLGLILLISSKLFSKVAFSVALSLNTVFKTRLPSLIYVLSLL